MRKSNINWTAKQVSKMVQKETLRFDNVVQRGPAWNVERKSLLLHSMMVGFPIPAFFTLKKEKAYEVLDGSQRCRAIKEYLNDEFMLKDVPDVVYEGDDGEEKEIIVNGLLYSQLPEEVRESIATYSLTFYLFEDIEEDEVAEMFYRLNNGKPLTAIELIRVKSKSLKAIRELGNHKLFIELFTEASRVKYTNESLVIKALMMLYIEEPSLDSKAMKKFAEEFEITEEVAERVNEIFDYVYNLHHLLPTKALQRKLLGRLNLISLVPVVDEAIERRVSVENFVEWFKSFFDVKNGVSCDEDYNNACSGGTARKENVNWRYQAIVYSFEVWCDVKEEEEEGKEENAREDTEENVEENIEAEKGGKEVRELGETEREDVKGEIADDEVEEESTERDTEGNTEENVEGNTEENMEENTERRENITEIEREAWGYVEYAEPLVDVDVQNYELMGVDVSL